MIYSKESVALAAKVKKYCEKDPLNIHRLAAKLAYKSPLTIKRWIRRSNTGVPQHMIYSISYALRELA
jgi:hypothetical protein